METFLGLQRGTSLQTVRTTMRSEGKHEFTAVMDGTEYLGLYFNFEEPPVGFYLIFTNDHLNAIVDPPKAEFERIPYRGRFREIPKPTDAEKLLRQVLELNDLSRDEMSEKIRRAIPPSKESLNMLPAYIITAPLFALRTGDIVRDHQTNAELIEKYDPFKIKLGFSPAEVEKAFGLPFRVVETNDTTIRVFGEPMYLRVDPAKKFSSVAVVFRNEKVFCIFSDHFLDHRWLGEP